MRTISRSKPVMKVWIPMRICEETNLAIEVKESTVVKSRTAAVM